MGMDLFRGDFLDLDNAAAINPCLALVSAGTDEQGAAVDIVSDRKTIRLLIFEMKNPNLEELLPSVDVVVNATG